MSSPPLVREERITMDDGVELAATLYLPRPELGAQPCILEALPYRKDDLTCGYRPEYARLAGDHGYAVARLDLRGTGSSGGDALDEYPASERSDLAAVMSWLAGQRWCDGSIGMYGTSYSGFNSLQLACERPPELKAVIAIYASDDRYTDDVHFRGGALKLLDLVDYCHYMTPMNALPPVPMRWGKGWREEWLRRIEAQEPWLLTWLEQQSDGPYWRQGSVRPVYARIDCPVLLVAGWADGYRNNSFRTVEALREAGVPHRLLAGPWAHASTATALPGPRIDLLPEMVAWWDRWLRGVDNGVDDGRDGRPALTCFVRSSTPPEPDLDRSEGHWLREEWPCPRSQTVELALSAGPPYAVRPDVGVDAWIDCAGHLPYGQSLDQRFDDAASLSWEWDAEERELIGHPVLRLRLSADQPVGFLSAKLCDVFPDGTSALVSRGSLNLTHRDPGGPAPLEPGRVYDVDLVLDACAYRFAPGQRLRLSLAGADWPNTAAPPRPLTLRPHGGTLRLPQYVGESPFPPPQLAPGEAAGAEAEGVTWQVDRDVLRRRRTCVVEHGSTYPIGFDGSATEHYWGRVSVDTASFDQRAEADVRFELEWPEVTAATRSALDVGVDAEAYEVDITLEVRENGEQIAARHWHRRIPRHLQ
jgi:uncharacterized protein